MSQQVRRVSTPRDLREGTVYRDHWGRGWVLEAERDVLRAALRPFLDDAGALREGGELFGLDDDVPVEVRVSAKQMRAAMAVLE